MDWQRRFFDLAGALIFVIALTIVSCRCWKLLRAADAPHDPVRTAMCDFQDVVYYPARAALAGVNPYDARSAEAGGAYFSRFPAGNSFPVYAPLIFLPSLPFAVLPLVPAEILYWLVSVTLLLMYSYVLLRIGRFPCRTGSIAGLAAVLLISRPGHANFYFGAITLPLTLITLGAWWCADRRPWLSAACLAVACIKPTFGGPLFVLMLLRGNYRAALGGLTLGIVANLAALAIFLPHELTNPRPLELLAANQAATDSDPAVDPLQSASRVDFPFVVERLWGQHLPGFVRFGVSLAILAIGGWNLRRLAGDNRAGNESRERLSAALACLTIAICIYHNIYDALLVAVPAAAAWRLLSDNTRYPDRRLTWPLMACLAVPAVNYLSSKQFLAVLADYLPAAAGISQHAALWTLLCTLNGACLTVAWCLLLAIMRRETQTEQPQPS